MPVRPLRSFSSLELGEPAGEVAGFGLRRLQRERGAVRDARLVGAIDATQQLGPNHVVAVELLETLDAVDEMECSLGPVDLGDGHRAVESDHGAGVHRFEEPVELCDLLAGRPTIAR